MGVAIWTSKYFQRIVASEKEEKEQISVKTSDNKRKRKTMENYKFGEG